MIRLIVLEVFDFEYTFRYGFKNLQDLSKFLYKLNSDYNNFENEYYIHSAFLNEDQINRLDIEIIER